jgi:hypothetical protein
MYCLGGRRWGGYILIRIQHEMGCYCKDYLPWSQKKAKDTFDSDKVNMRQLSTGRNVGRAENRPCTRQACGKFGTQSLKKSKETLMGYGEKDCRVMSPRCELDLLVMTSRTRDCFFPGTKQTIHLQSQLMEY